MAATITSDQARAWLTGNPQRRLRCIFRGQNRTMFYNSDLGQFGLFYPGRKKLGHTFDFADVSAIFAPPRQKDPAEANADLVNKYKKKAALAGFDNSWLRRIAAADPAKSLYENNVTTGNPLEGKVISVESVARACPYCVKQFLAALRERKGYHSPRFAFRGYEATLWINEPEENGDILAGLSVEFRNCGNGYYYLLINENEFIGYDID